MQTSINSIGQPVGFAGLVSANFPCAKQACVSEEASLPIRFGTAVEQGAARQGILLLDGSDDTVVGFLAFGYTHAPGVFGDIDSTGVGIVPKAQGELVIKGRLLAVVDASVTTIVPNVDRVFVRYSTNGGDTVLGAVRKDDDTGHSIDLTKVAIFRSAVLTAADGTKMAEIEVDFTNKP